MTNLLTETKKVLETHGKTGADVAWVGSRDGKYAIQWSDFEPIAKKSSYDAGFGSQKIVGDLVVVGEDWWLERHEYDGSEWWEFKTLPTWAPTPPLAFNKVKAVNYEHSLHDLMNPWRGQGSGDEPEDRE